MWGKSNNNLQFLQWWPYSSSLLAEYHVNEWMNEIWTFIYSNKSKSFDFNKIEWNFNLNSPFCCGPIPLSLCHCTTGWWKCWANKLTNQNSPRWPVASRGCLYLLHNRTSTVEGKQTELSQLPGRGLFNTAAFNKNESITGKINSALITESLNSAHLAQTQTQPQFSWSNKAPFCHMSPNHDRKVAKAAEPLLQSPRLIYCDSDSCLCGCAPAWKWARIHWGVRGSLNTATLNEGQSVLHLNVREDADAQEGNVSSQEASSGSRWRWSESGAPFLLRHQPQRGVLVCD